MEVFSPDIILVGICFILAYVIRYIICYAFAKHRGNQSSIYIFCVQFFIATIEE